MTVYITLTTAGTDSGPFSLYSNLDGFTTAVETGISKAALLAGYTSTLIPDFTATVRVKSTGVCVNYVDLPVDGSTTTTTTSTSSSTTTTTTTAAAPTIQLGTASCKLGNCNDNASCSVHLPVSVADAPVGYYVEMTTTLASDASASYSQANGYVVYTENNALGSIQIKLDLYDTFGGTLLATTGYQTVSHQSYWSMLNACS